jgi:pilus assembly protein CpaB
VEILAVDQHLDAPAENKVNPRDMQSVTLLVTPKQATQLDLGQNLGQLSLALRNPEDIAEASTEPYTVNQIRFREEAPLKGEPDTQSQEGPAWWDHVLSLAANTMAHVTPAEKEAVKPEPGAIRTLRGSHTGRVRLSVSRR